MKRTLYSLIAATAITVLIGCHNIDEYENTGMDNFEALWTLVDQHYCFFEEKGVDWDEVHIRYANRVKACRNQQDLFTLCSEMLDELRDGHVNLSSGFETSFYRKWWSDYPQNFNERVVEENYLGFNYTQLGAVTYTVLPQNVGYMRIPSFSSGLGQGNLDNILYSMSMCPGLIIDVRDNGGGDMTNVETFVSRFISERTLAGYIMHKDGPGHKDFSEPYAYYYAPPAGRLIWTKPVVVLTNRSTFSAANIFVSVMKLLPQVTVMGDVTGGGSGMPLSYELPIGWGVRMSAAPVLDAKGRSTEFGVEPTEGYRINITAEDMAAGRDPILEAAVLFLSEE